MAYIFVGFNMILSFLKYFVNDLFLISLQNSLVTDGSFQINPHAAGGLFGEYKVIKKYWKND